MPCHETVEDLQTEYEFFSQISEHPSLGDCCGPLTCVGLAHPALGQFLAALELLAVPSDYLDSFQTQVLDSGMLVITMCARHWFKHSQAIVTIGETYEHPELSQLSYYLYRVVCKVNKWDYKEITNYLKTIETLQQRE